MKSLPSLGGFSSRFVGSHGVSNRGFGNHLESKVSENVPTGLVVKGEPIRSILFDARQRGVGGGTALVVFNHQPVYLRRKSFVYFATLALNRIIGVDYVDKTDIEPGENQIKYIYQLRRELKRALHGSAPTISNNGNGGYMLEVDPEVFSFNDGRMRNFDDAPLVALYDDAMSYLVECHLGPS